MHEEIPSRVLTVLVLALVGVSVGWAGTAFGIGDPSIEPGQTPALVVSDTGVTISDGSRQATVLANTTGVQSLRIRDTGGSLTVDAERGSPLTDGKRERALAIAQENETVQRRLAELGDYALTVEPIRGVPETATNHVSFNVSETNITTVDESAGTFEIDFGENVSVERSEDGVTITPDEQRYVEDDVIVEIRDRDTSEVVYEVQVNIPNERVVIVTEA